MYFTISDFRGFKSIQRIHIAPLTILVGENSAGKTSFLAAIRYLLELFLIPEAASFNREPFLLGAYDQIAHFRGGKGGRANWFSFEVEVEAEILPHHYVLTSPRERTKKVEQETISCEIVFINEFSSPKLAKVSLNYKGGSSVIELQSDNSIVVKTNAFEKTLPETPDSLTFMSTRLGSRGLLYALDDLPFLLLRGPEKRPEKKQLDKLDAISARSKALRQTLRTAVYASAPVRTEPGRAYTPLDANPSPQGSHIPYLLARLKRHDSKKWDELKAKIDRFGQESGMFNKIDVKNLGRSESDPFQIYFDFGGPKRNIVDVGYGVSQVLPLITEVMSQESRTKFLFQQPEVHLHPQAQAALGTFLCAETARNHHSFVIESHSDFIIDRIRMAVRDKILETKQVSILYFSKTRLQSNVFQISIDNNGNIVDAPIGYRRFFLEEIKKSIGS